MAFNNTHTDIWIVSSHSDPILLVLTIVKAGAVAAFSIDLLVYPLDTIKTRIQSPDYATIYRSSSGTINRALFRGLYQGVGSVILATVPSAGAFFTTYEAAKASLLRLNDRLPSSSRLPEPVVNSLASSTGELVSCLILTPAEVLKQNAQVLTQSQTSTSASSARFTSTSRQALTPFLSRPHLLFRGYGALVARNLPFTGLHFPMYEALKARIHAHRQANGTATGSLLERGLVTAISAGASGSIAAVVTTPIDVVKTRIMLSAGKEGRDASSSTSSNANYGSASGSSKAERTAQEVTEKARTKRGGISGWRVGREVYRSDGVRGLFRGATLRGGWTAVGAGLYLGIYESGRSYLERRRLEKEDAPA